MNKRVLSLVLALVMILTMVPMTAMAASASEFSDVEQGKWYYTWIDNVVKEGYYAGYTDGTFRPNVAMTRAMFVMVLANMEEAELDNTVSAFKDVEAGKWYTGATKWASDNKIVAGYTDGTFKPETIVTREQMATIMQNYINWRSAETGEIHETDGSTDKFADDAKISKYAKEAVANCREWGLVDGYTDGTFRPQNGSTRAEVAAVISKLAWMVMGGGTGGGPRTYTVTYYANADGDDVTNMPGKVTNLEDGDIIEVAAGPDRDGYTFTEWNTKANGDGIPYAAGDDLTINKASVKLYAQWDEDEETVYTDYIYIAANAAAEDAEKAYKDYVNTTVGDSSLKLSNITVKKAEDPAGVRPQNVTLTGVLDESTVREVAKMAVRTAVELMTDDKPEKPVIKEMVGDVVDALEDEFGVNIFYPETKQEVIDAVTEEAWAKANETDKFLWDYFHNDEGAYYTGDVTVSIGDASATLTVDEVNNNTYFAESKKETAKEFGVAIAKELYDSLIKASNGKYISAAKVSFVLDIDFTVPTEDVEVGDTGVTYGEHVAEFPLCYPVTIALDFQNPDNMGVVAYKFEAGKGSSIKLTATKEMQDKYVEALDKAVKIALTSGKVQNKAESVINGSVAGIKNGIGQKLVDALVNKFGVSEMEAENVIGTYIETWQETNMPVDALYGSNAYDFIWNENDEAFLEKEIKNSDNSYSSNSIALHQMVKYVGDKAGDYAVNKMGSLVGWLADVRPATLKRNLEDPATIALVGNLNFDVDGCPEEVEDYIFAVICDKLNAAGGGIDQNHAEAAYDDMAEAINDVLIDEIKGHEYYDELQKALQVKSVGALKEAQLGNLATALGKDMVKDEAFRADQFMDEFVKVFRNIPESASVTVNGKTISRTVLNNIRNLDDAAKAEEVLDAASKLLADPALASLSVSDFAGNGQKITVAGMGYTYSFYLVIDVK